MRVLRSIRSLGSRFAELQPPQVRSFVVRPVEPTDKALLEQFYEDLSAWARRSRFLGTTRGLSPAQSVSFCSPDHHHRSGFVAQATTAFGPRILGHLCLEPGGPRELEVAIVVGDIDQHRGVGTALVRAGAAWARREGFTTLSATMLAANGPIHRLLTGMGLKYRVKLDAGTSRIEIDLAEPRRAA
jgi:GNAT superfamily N-acetyltransferase